MSPKKIDLRKLATVKDGGFEDEPLAQDGLSKYSDEVMREANVRQNGNKFKIQEPPRVRRGDDFEGGFGDDDRVS